MSDWLSGRRNGRVNYLLIILPKMISFALLLVIGFVCAWRGVLKDKGRSTLSGLLLSLVLPAFPADGQTVPSAAVRRTALKSRIFGQIG